MHPVLFEIHGFKIYTYGPIMAVGFLLAFFFMYHIAKRKNQDLEFYMDLYIWLIIGGLLGCKLLYNFIDYKEFLAHPIKMMNCRNGGLVWYGGVILDALVVIWYSRRKGLPILQVMDTLVAPMALGLAIGRLGCLMGGCCYGKPCSLPWAVTYPGDVNPLAGLPVHPTPIYESLASLLIAGIIYLAIKKDLRRGGATLIWFTLYPIARFIIEFFRGDEIRGLYQIAGFSISTSQTIGLIIFIITLALWVKLYRAPAVDVESSAVKAKAKESEEKPHEKSGKKKGKKKK